mgnify:CR=1 FL=1
MLRLNAFITIKPYFKNFSVFRIPLIGNPRARSQLARMLYDENIAYSFPHGEYLYYKGKPNETLGKIREIVESNIIQGNLILSSIEKPEKKILSPQDEVIIKPIVYSAFEKILESKGFLVPRRTIKKAIPQIKEKSTNRGFFVPLTSTSDVVVLRGLKYMLEIRPSGYGILWIDVYCPPLDLRSKRRLSPRELRERGLMELYHSKAVLKSKERLDMLHHLLNILCNNVDAETLRFEFPDGEVIEFSRNLLHLEAITRRWYF